LNRWRQGLGWAGAWAGVLLSNTVIAQDPVTPATTTLQVAQVQSLDRQEAEADRLKKLLAGKPKAYEDKLMDPATLPATSDADDAPPGESQMGYRSYLLESRFGVNQVSATGLSAQSTGEYGLRAQYSLESLNYGNFVIEADARQRSDDQSTDFGLASFANQSTSGRLTLRSLSLPITTRVFANSAAGDITSELSDAFSRNFRQSLGASTVRGISTQVYGNVASGAGFDFRAGTGARGSLMGGPYAGFEPSVGNLSWLGYSQSFGGDFYAGVQLNRATGVAAANFGPLISASSPALEDISSVAATVGYGRQIFNSGNKRVRLMLVQSDTSNASSLGAQAGRAHGIFVEGGFKLGRFHHELGAYSAEPNLRFGDIGLAADTRGSYWRVDHADTRFSWGAAVDFVQQNPANDPGRVSIDRKSATANASYRFGRDTLLGGTVTVSDTRYGDTALLGLAGYSVRSSNASAYYQTQLANWGRSNFNLTVYQNETLVANGIAATGDQFQWEHDWVTSKYENMRPEFTTSLGIANDRSAGFTQTYPTAGVRFRYWIDAGWSLGGNLNYSSFSGNLSTSQGLAGTLNMDRRLGQGWSWGATASLNQAVTSTTLGSAIDPFQGSQVSRSDAKSLYAYLRFEGNSGAPFQSAGRRFTDSAGHGRINGTVYFDANRNGEQEVGENGVANVEVFLDGGYRAVTDRNGQFEFPVVATGRHQLTLKLESVPLPWGLASDKGLSIDVPLRGSAPARIPVVRVAE
jgi:SdrD B-like domain